MYAPPVQLSRFCKVCNRKTLHVEEQGGCGVLTITLLLLIPTGGLSLLLPLFASFIPSKKRCQFCGTERRRL